ncbi:MAG: thioredoxin family protein [Bacteroidota bacterium]
MKKLLGLIALFALAAAFVIPTNGPGDGLKIGDKAPDFKLKHVDGNFYSLSQLQGQVKGYIIAFTCNTCPYAVMYEERLKQLHGKYADKGFPVIAINPNDPEVKPGDSFEAMQSTYKDKEFNFLYLYDEGQKVFPSYGATKTPHMFILDKSMTVQYIGAIDDNVENAKAVKNTYVEDAIEAIMVGAKPKVTETKAVGCSIKVKPVNRHLLKKKASPTTN